MGSVTGTSHARDGQARAGLVAWPSHNAQGLGRASPHPVCSVYGAARVQSALPDIFDVGSRH